MPKGLPSKGIYGWDSDNETWVKIKVDANGQIQITSTTLTTILEEIQHTTYGLSAIETLVDEIESLLKNETYGLSAIETLVDGLETAVGANSDIADMTDSLFAGQQAIYHSTYHHYAMIVADKDSLTADETEILTNFEKGHEVYLVDEDDVDSGNFDFDIVAGIFISASCTDMTKLNELTTVAVPIVTDSPEAALTILRMGDDTGGSGTSWGTSATQTQINIVDNTHEITLTLSTGNLTIYSTAQTINWLRASDLVGGGIELAEVAGDNTKTTIAVLPYDVDDEDSNAAPAIRVFVGGLTNHADLNTAGNTIFHDAETWILHQGIREIEVQGLGKINQILQKLGGELSNADNLYDYIVTGANEAGAHYTVTANKVGSVLERIEALMQKDTSPAFDSDADSLEAISEAIATLESALPADPADASDIAADFDRHLTPLDFWGDPSALVTITGSATDVDLPNVIVPTLPTGATIWKVQLLGFISAIRDTSTADNAVNGACNIRIKKSTGAWDTDDITAYNVQDNAFAVDVSTSPDRAGVPLIGNLNNDDLSGEVDGAATYNLRFDGIAADGANLTLLDVQVGLRVWIY